MHALPMIHTFVWDACIHNQCSSKRQKEISCSLAVWQLCLVIIWVLNSFLNGWEDHLNWTNGRLSINDMISYNVGVVWNKRPASLLVLLGAASMHPPLQNITFLTSWMLVDIC